ncbi:MAG: hypothetical protein HYT31_01640 [Parcubacteria group bacterium]|nr:hypothetical protein [Parcubacteria group bacterium]
MNQENKDDFFVKSQILSNISSVRKLLETDIFSDQSLRLFREPVFVSIVLKLNDLLQKYNQLDQRITFTNDVSSGDVTDLINKIRNAICHLDSPENLLDKKSRVKFVFCMVTGKGSLGTINDNVVANSDYEDDIAFFYGEYRIYLRRHLYKVLTEAIKIAHELYPREIYI